jgi:asparagine synthase (glutamine-hydrolysing)
MAHSLEVREPLMDHPLVEWLSNLPPELKLRNGEGKYLLKKGAAAVSADEILYRPKMGFAVPLGEMVPRTAARTDQERGARARCWPETGWFNGRFLQKLVDDHQSGVSDHSTPLWTLMMFESFLRNVTGASSAPDSMAAD